MTMLESFIAYLEQEIVRGSIYVLGAQGQRAPFDTAWIKVREHGDEKNVLRCRRLLAKRLAEGYPEKSIGAFDCSGLGMYWLENVKKLLPQDLNSNGMKGLCEPVSRDRLRRGDWVFILNDAGRAVHVGFAVNSRQVIECRGRDYGVVRTETDARPWNFFGRPRLFMYEIEGYTVSRRLKKGDKGEDVRALQHQLMLYGYTLEKHGADGVFGTETLNGLLKMQKEAGLEQTGDAQRSTLEALGLICAIPDEPCAELRAELERVKKELEGAKQRLKNAEKQQ